VTNLSRRELLLGSGLMLASSANPLQATDKWHERHSQPLPATESAQERIHSVRILDAEGFNPPFFPNLDFDPAKAVRIATDLHAGALRYPVASYYAYFPTRTKYPVHPQLTGNPMLETLRLCRAAGLRTIAYVPVNHPFMDIRDPDPSYPEWQRRDMQGRPFITTHFGFSRYYEGCLNSPLRQEIVELVREVLRYDFDLVYFDGPYQGMDHREELCHCKWCQKAFFEATSCDIPAPDGPINEIIACKCWINDQVARNLLQTLTDIVHETRGIPVFFNDTSMLSRGWCRSRSFPITDGFMFESAKTPEQKLFNLQLGRSTGKTIWAYVGYHSQYNGEHLMDKSIRGWYSYPLDSDDLLMDGAVAFSAGAGTVYWSLSRLYFSGDAPWTHLEAQRVRAVFDWEDRHSDLMRSASDAPQCGLLVSTQTIEWCGLPSYMAGAYPNGFHGVWRVMQEGCIAAEPFLDFALNCSQLDHYPLVYVANAICLSRAQCSMLADYVEMGGILVTTHMSGLLDEYGRPQEEYPLHNLLGVALEEGAPEEHPDLYLRLPGNRLIPQAPQMIRFRVLDKTDVLATTWDLPRQRDLGAAISRRKYGKGTVFYIGSSLESIYEETRIPAVRDTLLNLLDPYLRDTRRYRIPTDLGLFVQYRESSSALVLHLIANTGTKVKMLRVHEYYTAIENIPAAVKVGDGRRVESVHLLCANHAVKFSQSDGWVHFVIDRIRIHEVVLIRVA